MPASRSAPSRARSFVRAVIADRTAGTPAAGPGAERLADSAALLVSEIVTNALMHAGTGIDVRCTVTTAPGGPEPEPEPAPEVSDEPDTAGALAEVWVEVVDEQPSGRVPGPSGLRRAGRGFGLHLVGALADSWGVTYRRTQKSVWFRLLLTPATAGAAEPAAPAGSLPEPLHRELEAEGIVGPGTGPAPHRGAEREPRGDTFLAEAGELLSGQLDEDMVAALAGQLLVPRLADWCGVWLSTAAGGMRLSRVWHTDEHCVEALRRALEPDAPSPGLRTAGTPWPWPGDAGGGESGAALAFSLVAGGACQGALVLGRAGPAEVTGSAARMIEDVARRVAQSVLTARQYTHQAGISSVLQRRQLPSSLASLPGVESAIVYEPHGRGQTVGGDFYDLFPLRDGRWSFLLGDVQGKDAEAMSVTGLTRQMIRLLARDGHGVASVLGKLNAVMTEEGEEAVAVGGEDASPRFLSLVYGELVPDPEAGGAHCTLASAGHPPPLRLAPDGRVTPVTAAQLLLGIDETTRFTADAFDLAPGETLLCVTDGVTERRSGTRQLDDDDGLAAILAECAGMGAMAVAEWVRQAAHDFGPEPVEDDLAVLALHAVPRTPRH
ncbi:SpoIIE family protein phosphatase [Streptomyces sp. HNM0574]|nr:SpoIIE family protein phosphatase [Streptomyces sp. HNM0574]